MLNWCPFATKRPSPNFSPAKERVGYDAIVLHIAQGGAAGSLDWLTNPASEVSSNFFISKNGDLFQLVSLADVAWCNGLKPDGKNWKTPSGKPVTPSWRGLRQGLNPNRYTLSIEHDGYTGEALPAAMQATQTRLLKWLCEQLGWARLVPGQNLIGHGEINPVDKSFCPGKAFDFAAIAAAVSPTTAHKTRVIGTGPSITLGQFRAWLKRRKAPIVDVVIERIYQLCGWLDIDPAFLAAIWSHETSQTPGVIGSSDLFGKSNNAGAIVAYGDRWPSVAHNGRRFNKYESAQLGLMHLVMHLKQIYGAVGLLDLEDIMQVYAPGSDGNSPSSYIQAVLRDMKEMKALNETAAEG
jgi:N-acetyl-anhydromuramyl-L-alanine amidase AmpD